LKAAGLKPMVKTQQLTAQSHCVFSARPRFQALCAIDRLIEAAHEKNLNNCSPAEQYSKKRDDH
jgi:hypothetical protein